MRFEAQEELRRLDDRLGSLEARDRGICPKREQAYVDLLANVLKNIAKTSPETSQLMAAVWKERRMALDYYISLYENSVDLGTREAMNAENDMAPLQQRHDDLVAEIQRMKLDLAKLHTEIRAIERTSNQARTVQDRLAGKKIDALHASFRHLKDKQQVERS